MGCAPLAAASACFLLVVAAIVQTMQGYPDLFSVSFLLLGVTSVIHHSRLERWWILDVWRLLDYFMIAVFSLVASLRYRRRQTWFCTVLFVSIVTAAIWTGAVSATNVPVVHSSMHLAVAACALSCEATRKFVD